MARNVLFNKSNGVMPEKFITRHKYITPINFTTTLGVSAVQIYRANGIYDPDQTGTGVVATGFTTMSGMYSYHRVYACSINITVTNTSATPIIFSIVPTRTATSIQYLAAKSYSDYKEIIVGQSAGPSTKTIHHFINIGKFMDLQSREKDLMASGNNNPGEQCYWVVLATSADGTTASSCTAILDMTYYAEWNGLKTIA